MSEIKINKTYDITDASELLSNPNILTLNTKDKLILNNININIEVSSSVADSIKNLVMSGVTILGVNGTASNNSNNNTKLAFVFIEDETTPVYELELEYGDTSWNDILTHYTEFNPNDDGTRIKITIPYGAWTGITYYVTNPNGTYVTQDDSIEFDTYTLESIIDEGTESDTCPECGCPLVDGVCQSCKDDNTGGDDSGDTCESSHSYDACYGYIGDDGQGYVEFINCSCGRSPSRCPHPVDYRQEGEATGEYCGLCGEYL